MPGIAFYDFADFRLDPVGRLLLRQGEPVRLPPKALDLLLLLVLNRNQELTKDELMSGLWLDSFVEKSNLSQYVFLLRKALGQTLAKNRFILTIPGRGYRFVGQVTPVGTGGGVGEVRSTSPSPELPAAGEPIRSIAVLPFRWLGAKTEEEYLGLGLADALITRLSHIEQLAVRPTGTILKYAEEEPLLAGRELGVDSVLTGRLQRAEGTLRVTAQLVRVADGDLLWAEKFDESSPNLLAVQDSIAEAVATALTPTLPGPERERVMKRPTESPRAYQAYLKGRYYSTRWTESGWRKGIEYFHHAIAVDPNYALAYAGLADAYYIVSNLYVPPREAMPKAKAAARKALELDDTLAEAHTSLALALAFFDWEWAAAELEFKRAIELNPRYAAARLWYGRYLTIQGRFDAATAELERGQLLDPLSPSVNAEVGRTLLYMRRYEEAVKQLQETLELDPGFWPAHLFLGWAYEQKGYYTEAVGILGHASALDDNPRTLASLGHAYGVSGRRSEADAVLHQLVDQARDRYVSPYYMALIHASLGENDPALAWLEKAREDRSEWLVWLKVDPRLESLRGEARFTDLVRRVFAA